MLRPSALLIRQGCRQWLLQAWFLSYRLRLGQRYTDLTRTCLNLGFDQTLQTEHFTLVNYTKTLSLAVTVMFSCSFFSLSAGQDSQVCCLFRRRHRQRHCVTDRGNFRGLGSDLGPPVVGIPDPGSVIRQTTGIAFSRGGDPTRQSKRLKDVPQQLRCEGGRLQAHPCVLGARDPLFGCFQDRSPVGDSPRAFVCVLRTHTSVNKNDLKINHSNRLLTAPRIVRLNRGRQSKRGIL